jgi:hypothetical protein
LSKTGRRKRKKVKREPPAVLILKTRRWGLRKATQGFSRPEFSNYHRPVKFPVEFKEFPGLSPWNPKGIPEGKEFPGLSP